MERSTKINEDISTKAIATHILVHISIWFVLSATVFV